MSYDTTAENDTEPTPDQKRSTIDHTQPGDRVGLSYVSNDSGDVKHYTGRVADTKPALDPGREHASIVIRVSERRRYRVGYGGEVSFFSLVENCWLSVGHSADLSVEERDA